MLFTKSESRLIFFTYVVNLFKYLLKIDIFVGTENESLQREQREKVLKLADFIIPGHGPMFPVPTKFKTEAGS